MEELVVTYFSLVFWRKAAERAIKSAGQGVVYALTLAVGSNLAPNVPPAVNAFLTDWTTVAGTAAGWAILSLATSIASAKVGPADDPSTV